VGQDQLETKGKVQSETTGIKHITSGGDPNMEFHPEHQGSTI